MAAETVDEGWLTDIEFSDIRKKHKEMRYNME